jgi:hypothetical protein
MKRCKRECVLRCYYNDNYFVSGEMVTLNSPWLYEQRCHKRDMLLRGGRVLCFGHVMSRGGLENIELTGKIEGRRGRGRQCEKMLIL